MSDHQQAEIRANAENLAAAYRSTRTMLIELSLAAVAVACLMAYLLARAIKKPLNHAVAVLGEIERGNYTNTVTVSSQDEIGQTLRGLERMQVALRERTEKEHASAMENARIRTALDRRLGRRHARRHGRKDHLHERCAAGSVPKPVG